LYFQEMADITSKAALAPLTPKMGGNGACAVCPDPKHQSGVACAPNLGGGGGALHSPSGFNSLPSSIHHGLSERLHGLTEKLHALKAGKDSGTEAPRSRTGKKERKETKLGLCKKNNTIIFGRAY
jgi:hypothetical protein